MFTSNTGRIDPKELKIPAIIVGGTLVGLFISWLVLCSRNQHDPAPDGIVRAAETRTSQDNLGQQDAATRLAQEALGSIYSLEQRLSGVEQELATLRDVPSTSHVDGQIAELVR